MKLFSILGAEEAVTRNLAHSLEGMGGTMGFPEVSVAAAAISRAARAHDWDRCRLLQERLHQWHQVAEASTGGTKHE